MTKSRSTSKPAGLPIIHPFAAGIDIGSRFHVAAVSPDLCDEPVQTFQAFTSDLERMADWLVATGTKTVVMESTGVYWVAALEVLESRGLEVILANAREARAVPGRKSDVIDAQWLQPLHGLLRASFRPGRDIAELRAYLRARERHTDYAAAHIQHMQKALTFMNIQLHHVIATITGVTGMRIIRAIVAGERDPDKLAAMRDVRCKESIETIRAALVGNYQPEHVFALKQALALYDFYQQCINECDAEIERAVARLNVDRPVPESPLPKAKPEQDAERSQFRRTLGDVPARRHRPHPDPRHRAVSGAAPDRRMRYRPQPLAYRQALYLMAHAVARLQDQRRHGSVLTHAKDQQSDHRGTAPCGSYCRPQQYCTWRVLPTACRTHWQCQGRDCNSTQDCGPVLQRDAIRHGLPRPRSGPLRTTIS